MSTGVEVADWIKRIADKERTRDAVRVREEETTARKADLVRVHGRRLIDELRATVTRDIEAWALQEPSSHSSPLGAKAIALQIWAPSAIDGSRNTGLA